MVRSLISAATVLSGALLATARPPKGPPSGPSHPKPYHPGSGSDSHNGQCNSITLPIHVQANAVDLGFPSVTDKYSTTQWAVSGSTWSMPGLLESIEGNVSVDETFNIYGQLCVPRDGTKKEILHLATHGLIFDSGYWDVSIDPAHILTYDRLATGRSDKPDGYIVAQGATEVEILRGITELVRSGEIYDHIDNVEDKLAFESIVHIGHSFGSFITTALLALYGSLSDGAILTGYIPTSHASLTPTSLGLDFGRTNDPKFADRPNAYVVPARDIDIQTGFFSALANTTVGIGGFDPALLEFANSTKQPGTIAELTTLPLLALYGPANDFTGPVQIMEAEFDYIICGGDCHDWDQAAIDATYTNAKDIEVYIQRDTGHGLTAHRNASSGYQATFDFLARNGL